MTPPGVGLAVSAAGRSPGLPSEVPRAAASVRRLAADLYLALAGEEGNLALSAYSVSVALAMTANGARGRTAEELARVLHADDLDRLNGGLSSLTVAVEGHAGAVTRADGSSAEIALAAANAIFGQTGTMWEPEFLDALAGSYGAGVRLVDYVTQTEAARTLVNEWTAEQTHGRIPEIVPGGVLSTDTRLVLVNAVYLKAPWEQPFLLQSTRRAPFHREDGSTVEVDLMGVTLDRGEYAAGPGWQAVRLPYAGGGLAMTILLPDSGRLAEVERLLAGDGLGEILDAGRPTGVQLSLPRFEFRATAALADVLSALGMPTAFTEEADFSGMTGQERLRISDVLHEAFIAVDEEGTEAAAATAVLMSRMSLPVLQPVVVDRPFLFVIHDVEHRTPLFLGRVADPTAS